jgi:hypothetical protein
MTAFGIEISESKSIICDKNSKHVVGEIAKRLILDGQEISPPTSKLIYKTFRDWRLAPMLFEDMVRRGWCVQSSVLLELLQCLYSKNWTNRVTTVLSFPFAIGKGASIWKVTDACSGWEEYSKTELAILFVRYRIELLERTAFKTSKLYSLDLLMGTAPMGTNPEIYNLSPVKTIRKEMTDKTIRTIRRLNDFAREIPNIDEESIVIPEIQEEELYYPDLSLRFLEKKYQRQQYSSNTLLNFKRMIDNGTLQTYLRS